MTDHWHCHATCGGAVAVAVVSTGNDDGGQALQDSSRGSSDPWKPRRGSNPLTRWLKGTGNADWHRQGSSRAVVPALLPLRL